MNKDGLSPHDFMNQFPNHDHYGEDEVGGEDDDGDEQTEGALERLKERVAELTRRPQ